VRVTGGVGGLFQIPHRGLVIPSLACIPDEPAHKYRRLRSHLVQRPSDPAVGCVLPEVPDLCMEVAGRAEQGGGQGVIVCIVEHAELLVQCRDSDQVERRRMFLHVANAANCVRMEREYAGTKQGIVVGKTDAKRICQSRPEPRLRLGLGTFPSSDS
jgi:hypothetical protein